MHNGQTLKFVRGLGNPLMAPQLGLVSALLTLGFQPSTPGKYILWTVESTDGVAREEHVWSFDGSPAMISGESLTLEEVARRFEDEEWLASNPEHPVAVLGRQWAILTDLRGSLWKMKPMLKISRASDDGDSVSRRTALIPQDASPEKRAEILAAFDAEE